MTTQATVRIGTRGSKLAVTQSRLMQARIATALGVGPEDYERVCPLIVITTSGERTPSSCRYGPVNSV